MTRILTALLLTTAACTHEPAAVPVPGEAPLDTAMRVLQTPALITACGDMVISAATADDDTALFFVLSGDYVLESHNGATHLDFTLPHPDVDVYVQWGDDVTSQVCNDAPMGTPVVNGEAFAVSGSISMDLTPLYYTAPWEYPTDVEVQLTDVVFEDAAGRQRTYTVDLGNQAVGWFPG